MPRAAAGRITARAAIAVSLAAALAATSCVVRRERRANRSSASWRTLAVARQLHDSAAQHVRVQFPIGTVRIGAAPAPLLYVMTLRYDERAARPTHRYDESGHALRIGVPEQRMKASGHGSGGGGAGELRLGLSPRVPVDLDVALGAGEAEADLGGLAVTDLRVRAGASSTTLRWSAPNAARMRSLELQAGAAGLKAVHLANANAADVRVNGGVCDVELDLAGAPTADMNVDAHVGLGHITVFIPAGVAARVEVDKFLASVNVADMERRGDAYYTAGYDAAPRKINVRAKIAVGSVEIDH